jgi:ABC-type bacteriocin/lantibiotic exporter with double-glycine peptidase domain
LLNESAKAELERLYAQVSRSVVSEGLPQLLMLGITAWLAVAVLNGTSTLEDMMMVTMLLGAFTRGAVGLINKAGAFQALGGSVNKVNRVLETSGGTPKTDIAEVAWLGEPHTSRGVVLKGVWYRYEADQRWVLRDHHLCFPRGAISTLRAPSGSGKSTVLRLIAGLIEPERGEVQVHGHNPARYSGLVAYLPRQSHLLEASIATNLEVLCGKTPAELEPTARLTGLHQLVEALAMGYETLVSSLGSSLSAGQCQLVLLTAAIAQERPVLLLDESTFQIDRRTRETIDWPALIGDRTVIVVDHDQLAFSRPGSAEADVDASRHPRVNAARPPR